MTTPLPSDAAAVARFRSAFNQVAPGDGEIGLAVSGGPDSLALLLLAQAAFPDRIAVATVDHGLRAESAAEAAFVANLCGQLGTTCAILKPGAPITGNIQSSARNARYALLSDWADAQDLRWIATAHHADDQLETVLMRLARGSGIDGLAAIRGRNGRIVRPLLEFTKAELEAICASAEVAPRRDPSNENSAYDRVAMRQWLASAPHPFDPLRVARTAAALAESAEALAMIAEDLADKGLHEEDGTLVLDVSGLPRELQRRLLLIALRKLDPDAAPRGESVDAALDRLPEAKSLTLGNILVTGGTRWRFTQAPSRRTG